MTLKNDWVNGDTFTPAQENSLATQVNTNTTDIGNRQPLDSDLTAIAALTPSNDDVVQRKAGAWTNRTVAQLKTDLAVATDITTAALVGISTQTASYTLVLGDAGKAVEMSNASAVIVTVPPNSSVAFPIGTVVELLQVGAGQVSVAAGAGVTINTASSLVARAQWAVLGLRKRATDAWVLSGDMV